ncbi:MAG TPA: serine/threonine-protein kinase [Gemmatimonadales bacterium]
MIDLLPQLQAALGSGYRFERELGGGGMSRVYVAEEIGLGRRVVVKVLAPELSAGVNADRFRRETQLAAGLQHPHIVPLLTAGTAGDLLYYTMPLVDGESLRARVARDGPLPIADASRILKDVADALAYAHARGLVHRDIKPDNVLISGKHALVTDFGIAKAISQASGSAGLTSVGMAIGTPAYMAPEQAAGDPNVDHRADIYSFGAMAYEALTGRPPFSGMSPHQMLAAHIADPVDDITTHRAGLPPELATLVMKCLEKEAADRPQTATELVQVLEGTATPTTGTRAMRAARRRRLRVIGASVVVVAGAAVATGVFRSRGGPALNADLVAVAPFDVLDPPLALWREGLVDVLSRSLDGAGPLRTVSPTLVVKRWSGRADAASAQALGHATGARTVIYGGLVASGPDSVRLTASVLDVPTGNAIGDIDLKDRADRLDRLADSAAVRVLREIAKTRAIGLARATPIGSTSIAALKAFLTGEQFLRRSQYDSALVYDQQAIALDSNFTLALSHASMAAGWQQSGGDASTRAYAVAAGRRNHGLAPRDSFLVVADSLTSVVFGGAQFVGGAWWSYGRRLIATLDSAVKLYPGDPELWYMLGDARFHAGVTGGAGRGQALDAFDHAIALDSSFSPAYIHSVGLALQLRGSATARRYIAGFLKASGTGRYASAYQLFDALLDPRVRGMPAGEKMLDSLSAGFPTVFNGGLDRWPDSGETAIRAARAYTAAKLRTASKNADSLQARAPLAMALAYRGHMAEAYALTHDDLAFLFGDLAIVGGVPRDTAERIFAEWVTTQRKDGPFWMVDWWGARGDTARLTHLDRSFTSALGHLPPQAPQFVRDIVGYLVLTTRAYHTLARGDTTAALQQFLALPDSACFNICSLDVLVRAQLLDARGRTADALATLDRHVDGSWVPVVPSEVLRMLERGRLNEKLGHKDAAVAAYAYVADAWAHADAPLQPYVAEARAGLARLVGEGAH